MNEQFRRDTAPRFWRQDQGALAAGVCSGLAEDLDLPLPLIRLVALCFVLLPTGLAYLALTLLLRRRPVPAMRRDPDGIAGTSRPWRPAGGSGPSVRPQPGQDAPGGQSWALLRHRFEMLEPRLGRIEAFVTSSDFELHRGFRRMKE